MELKKNVCVTMSKETMNQQFEGGCPLSFKPSAFYFRKALRAARTKKEAIEAGLVAVRELENLKDWVRSLGLQPPKRFVMTEEALEKNWECCEPSSPSSFLADGS